jgi:hypothetical protein
VWRSDQLRKSVQHQADPLQVPFPAAATIRAPLAKPLGLVADRLVEEVAALVAVIVRRDYPPALAFASAAVALRPAGESMPNATLTISGELMRVSIAPGVTL